VLGFLFPLIGILSFIIPVFICKTKEPFEHNIDDAFDDEIDAEKSNKIAAASEV
jgi:hypothetical protein